MDTSILNKPIVLSLNRAWQIIGHRTVKQALVALNGGDAGQPPAMGLDIAYPKLEDGSYDFDRPLFLNPVSWKDWMDLPIREFDLFISTPNRKIRVPTVMVSTQYDRMPMKRVSLSSDAIFVRDGGICQYTGEFVGKADGNLDHVIPKERGGRNTFENLVWSKRSVNSAKANRLPHEAGLKLLRRPKAPPALPASAAIRDAKHPDWRHFLH